MTAIIIFYGAPLELKKVQRFANDGLTDTINNISSPKEFDVDGIDAIYYTVDFAQNGWLNIIELQEDLAKQNCFLDIIHVLYDETSIEVLCTDSKYDAYEDINDFQRMQTLAGLYNIDIEPDEDIDEEFNEYEDDDSDYSDFD